MSNAMVRFVRPQIESPDAYDRHPAVITVDAAHVGEIAAGDSADIPVEVGTHEVGVRLGANFGTAKVTVDIADGTTTTITCEKAHPARNQLLHPSHYWRLTVTT